MVERWLLGYCQHIASHTGLLQVQSRFHGLVGHKLHGLGLNGRAGSYRWLRHLVQGRRLFEEGLSSLDAWAPGVPFVQWYSKPFLFSGIRYAQWTLGRLRDPRKWIGRLI